jgi:hypothetical protein
MDEWNLKSHTAQFRISAFDAFVDQRAMLIPKRYSWVIEWHALVGCSA